MERKKIIIGNWKMELSHKGQLEVARAVKKLLKDVVVSDVDVVVCPSYPSLSGVADMLAQSSKVVVGAQNVHWEEKGAFTGQVSVSQVSQFVDWCIAGHSEQRALTGESDEQVQKKVFLLIQRGIVPIVCVGETREEREADEATEKIEAQITTIFSKATRTALTKMVIAYEPIWAISTGEQPELPDPADVSGMMLLIRKLAAARFGNEAAQRLRIIYGGSVAPGNVEQYAKEPGVDGFFGRRGIGTTDEICGDSEISE